MIVAAVVGGLVALGSFGSGPSEAATQAMCEREDFRAFEDLVGAWRVTAQDRGPDGEYETTVGDATIGRTLEDCGLTIRYSGQRQGAPYEVGSIGM